LHGSRAQVIKTKVQGEIQGGEKKKYKGPLCMRSGRREKGGGGRTSKESREATRRQLGTLEGHEKGRTK